MDKNDKKYMNIAKQEALKGKGFTWTNPIVGAVIVKNNQIIGKGYHHKYGQPHAEIEAFNNVNDQTQIKDATLYVTLEPCNHYGKMPPCADQIIKKGIKRVVIGQQDPNPLVNMQGINKLRQHNICCDLINDTYELNHNYNFFYKHQRPFITLKYAMSLDGKINFNKNTRTIISNQIAYQDSQELRKENQAILIGENTFKIDNPLLTIRNYKGDVPIKIVLLNDPNDIDLKANIFKSHTPIFILAKKKLVKNYLPKQVKVFTKNYWDALSITKFLYQQGIQSLLVEGESYVQSMFFKQQLVDKIIVYIAPLIFGKQGLPAVNGHNLETINKYHLKSVQQLADNIKIIAVRGENN